MARTVIADSSYLVALLSRNDQHRQWALNQALALDQPLATCEAVLSESFHLLGCAGRPKLAELLRRDVLSLPFHLDADTPAVLALMAKYADVPMSLADACLVRMSEGLPDPVVLTTDGDFRLYRRHGRQVVPCRLPGLP